MFCNILVTLGIIQQLWMHFADNVNVSNHDGLSYAELTWYSQSAIRRICL